MDAPNIFIESNANNLFGRPAFIHGNKPSDGGNLIISPEERDELIKNDPAVEAYIRPFAGGADFLKGLKRYCLWLVDVDVEEIYRHPDVVGRLDRVKRMRLASTARATQEKASTPWLFFTVTQPTTGEMLVGPQVSSGRREYVPFGFCSSEIIANDMLLIMPGADLYSFAVMMSSVHNAWVRAFAGRLKSDFRYSINIVYNNFPWCSPTGEQKAKIDQTAQDILDARNNHPDKSLADLYDPDKMPDDLKAAHEANDKAVMDAYGFSYDMTEPEIVAELMKMYQKLTA